MSKIEEICKSFDIHPGVIDCNKYKGLTVNPEKILPVIVSLDYKLKHNFILIGGQIAHPELLGYRQMRKLSNDIDGITTIQGIAKLKEQFGEESNLIYSRKYDCLFLEYKGIPIGFQIDRIHDWSISNDLRKTSIKINVRGGQVNVTSQEYNIMLKTRRAQTENRFFGKDKTDIVTLLLAPNYRKELKNINHAKIADLMFKHVTSEYMDIKKLIDNIGGHLTQLRKREKVLLQDSYQRLKNSAYQIYLELLSKKAKNCNKEDIVYEIMKEYAWIPGDFELIVKDKPSKDMYLINHRKMIEFPFLTGKRGTVDGRVNIEGKGNKREPWYIEIFGEENINKINKFVKDIKKIYKNIEIEVKLTSSYIK